MSTEKKDVIKKIFFWVAIVFMAFWMIFPFYWMINSALKNEAQLQMTPATFVPRDPSTGEIR
jgi:trehalose/maltose transport system permease protein